MVNSEAPNGSAVGDSSPLPIPDIVSNEKIEDEQSTSSNGRSGSESPVLTDRELTAAWIQRKNVSDEHLRTIDAINAGEISLQDAFLEIMPSFADIVPYGGFSEDVICNLLSEFFDTPPPRHKLPQYNTFQDAINLIRNSKKIMILTGAGVSVSCGIPDFRSKDGIYSRLHKDFPDLPDPTAMFDIRYFDHNPQPFYNFAKEIFMGQFEPSLSHKFIRQLELSGQLLRNYTQNIDTLEAQTGIQNVIECHGSFSKASCRLCKAKFDGEVIREDVAAQRVARCPECKEGVIKPDITFFGEDLPPAFHHAMTADKDEVDLLIVMGSSLKVGPVNAIPFSVPKDVPQILINRERLKDYEADIEILGNCDEILREISFQLGGDFEQMVRTHDEKMKSIKSDYYGYPQPRVCLDHKKFEEYMLADAKSAEMVIETFGPEEPSSKRQKVTKLRYEKRFVRVGRKFPQGGYYFQTDPNVSIFFGSYATFDRDEMKLCISAPRYPRLPAPKIFGCCSGGGCNKSRREKSISESSISSSDNSESKSQRGGSEPPEIYERVEEAPSLRAASCEPAVDVDSLIPVSDFARALEEEEDSSSDSDDDLGSNYASSGGETPKYEFPDLVDQDSLDDTPTI